MMARRIQGIYRRRLYWYFKYKNETGNWIERTTGTRVYAEARKFRATFLRDLEEGKLPNERSRWTLQEAVDQWLGDRKCRIGRASYASELTITRALLRILGADTSLHKLADIQVVRGYETCRLRQNLKAKSVNNEVCVLAGILRQAKLWRRVETEYKRLPVKKSDIPDALTREEAHRLIQFARVAPDEAVAPFVALLSYSTGLRSGEIKHLQIGSINLFFPNPHIMVKRATTKTNAGVRYVALDKIAVWSVRKLLKRAARLGACDPNHYLLPTLLDRHTRASDPLSGNSGWDPTHPQSSWDAEWDDLRRKVRLEHRRFHDLRHSYITRAAEAGVAMMVIQAGVGHISDAMTAHYTHISERSQHLAALQIQGLSADLLRQLGLPVERSRENPQGSGMDMNDEGSI